MKPVSSSVVICAYTLERWEDLQAAVISATQGTVRPDEIVVVIDYNDLLLERARGFCARAQSEFGVSIRALPNAGRRGLSGGRNTAIENASGDVVVFLDDDAVAEPSWLAALLAHYSDETVLGVGGLALPDWPTGVRPALFPAQSPSDRGEFDWVVGCTYRGMPEVATPIRNLMGCNMSFRRSIFGRVGGFSEDLGRVGRTPLGCEETEFCIRIRQASPAAEIIFEPAAVVRHRVTPDRIRWMYLFNRCYSEGLSKVAVSRLVGQQAALESERRYVRKILPTAMAREWRAALQGKRSGFAGLAAISGGLAVTAVGYLRGSVGKKTQNLGQIDRSIDLVVAPR